MLRPGVLAVLVLVLLVLHGASLTAQQPAPVARDGAIAGQVVDGVSGKPVSAVLVSIAGPGLGGRAGGAGVATPQILTGGDGRFLFRDLAAGSFTITATKGGYAEGASGRRRPGGASQPVAITAAQKTADVTVRIWKNGAITGTVLDEAGEPVVGLNVRALVRTLTGGRRQFNPTGGSSITDDRGVYRFSNLPPGEYMVLASPPPVSVKTTLFEDVARTGRATGELAAAFAGSVTTSLAVGDASFALVRGGAVPPPPIGGRMQIYPPTFHPSALGPAQSAVVALASGEERASVDIQLQPVPAARVSGTLLSPSGAAGMVALRLIPSGIQEMSADGLAPVSITDASGAFTFAAVVPGQYSLRSTGGPGLTGVVWVDMPLTVAGDDLDGIVATLSPPLRVSARMQFDGNAERPPLQQSGRFTTALFSLEALDRPAGPASIAGTLTDGVFTLAGYLPGRYRVRVANSPQGWMFKAAMLNGVDVSETPFDLTRDVTDLVLTFTDRWSGISGLVQGPGADAATVLAFTTDSQAWTNAGASPRRLRSARVNASGQFGFGSLPPGEYFVIAVPEEDAAEWRDPEMLESLARIATRITILEGEHKMIDLRLSEVRR